jgi:hypothetical protein
MVASSTSKVCAVRGSASKRSGSGRITESGYDDTISASERQRGQVRNLPHLAGWYGG